MTVSDYLFSSFTQSVRDPLWGDILFTEPLLKITEHPQFQKLGRIKQLGPVSLVYPGAVHTRLSHSLGVYDVSRRLIISLLKKEPALFSLEGVCSFLCASLLHDLGHFPFAHSLKDVVKREHETLATDIILSDKKLSSLIADTGADIKFVCSIIDPDTFATANTEIVLYQNLLSGTLDPDKLDYLCRDAYFCGVPYGIQDVSWITEHIKIFNNRPALAVSNASSVEHLLFSKYLMYKNVYWHEKTRCATAMVKQAVVSALQDNVLKEEELYFLDDDQFIRLCKSKNYKPFELVDNFRIGKLLHTNMSFACPKGFSQKDKQIYLNEALSKFRGRCNNYEVILDVPEPITFETKLTLLDNNSQPINFGDSDGVFSSNNVSNAFTSALRKVRIFSPLNEAL